MLQFIIKRLFSALVVIFLIMTISFFLMRFAPGGPFDQDKRLNPETLKRLNEHYGLNLPIYQQYFREIGRYATGDFGYSYYQENRSVRKLILENLPNSMELGMYAMLIALLIGIPAGLLAGLKQNTALDYSMMSIAMVGVSVPAIVLAPLMIYLFVFKFGWFDPHYTGWEPLFRIVAIPSENIQKPAAEIAALKGIAHSVFSWATGLRMQLSPIEPGVVGLVPAEYKLEFFSGNLSWVCAKRKILPALTLGLYYAAYFARLTRGGMLEIVRQDYIRTARAKGLSLRAVVLRHALKGALIPPVTFLGPALASILTGSFVVELIFNIPGVSAYFVQGAFSRDYPVVMGVIVLYSALLVVMNLLVDIAYTVLDPRVSYDK